MFDIHRPDGSIDATKVAAHTARLRALNADRPTADDPHTTHRRDFPGEAAADWLAQRGITDTTPITFEDAAGNPAAYGLARARARHGDQHAQQVIAAVDAAYAALSEDNGSGT